MTINAELLTKVNGYFADNPDLEDEACPSLLIDFVVEKFESRRAYPSNFTEDDKYADEKAHLSTLAMAVVDIFVKTGAEGQIASTEKNISRTYENAYISASVFADIFPFVKAI